jgi:hypothetical protein
MSLPFPIYKGILDRKLMLDKARIAYEAYCSQKARSKKAGYLPPEYSTREFVGWWLHNLKSFKGTVPTCGRIDHKKGYSWDNIFMQDMKENSREGFLRNKMHIKASLKNREKVNVHCKKTGDLIAVIPSIRDTARVFSVSQRLVQFLVRGKYKSSKKINFNLVSVKA